MVIAQGLGLLSFVLSIATFTQKDDRLLKITMLVLNVNHTLHYLFLGSIVSALSSLLNSGRTAFSLYTSSKYIAALFIVLGVCMGGLVAEEPVDWIPIIGSVIGTFSLFILKGKKMRIGFLMGACCWLINNIIVGSLGGILMELMAISVNLMTIYRLSLQPLCPSDINGIKSSCLRRKSEY